MTEPARQPPAAASLAYDEGVPARGIARVRTFASLRHRNFRLLWITVVVASAAQWMEQVALSWLAYELTGDPFVLGLVNGFRALPALISGPFGGVAADRMERKKLILLSQVVWLVPGIILTFLIYANQVEVWHLMAFGVASGLGGSFNNPVRQSLLPNLVPRDDLTNAVALQSSAFQLSRLIGPTMAGLIIAWQGIGATFVLRSAMFLVVIAITLLMYVPPLPRDRPLLSVWNTLQEGMDYIRGERTIFSLILMALIPQLLAQPYFTLLPVFAKDVLGTGPEGFGLLVTLPGIGAAVATLTIASMGTFRRGRLVMVAAVGQGLFILALAATSLVQGDLRLLGVASANFLAASVVLVFMGASQMGYNALTITLLHSVTSDEMRGRVMSVYLLDQGLAPLGTMWAGFLASVPALGAPGAYMVMGSTVLAMAVTAHLRFPHIRRL